MMHPAYSSAQRAPGNVNVYLPLAGWTTCSAPVWSINRACAASAGTAAVALLAVRAHSTRVVRFPRLSVTTVYSARRSSRAEVVPA